MSDRLAIRLAGLSKMYRVFDRRRDRLVNALGLGRLFAPDKSLVREFWSLRDVSLEVRCGTRLGIIGRNGAGKSTLLKIISGSLAPTEGVVEVSGRAQALFDASAGFHPEFTGYENIRAALTYQGLSVEAIELAVHDIAEFTELDDFLGQPLRTYSLGMQARLAFATATAVKPDILIIDEVLGAGDAYFVMKSTQRMRSLVEESGATVLLVSHALDQVLRYCDECVWIERGRVVKRGPTLDVVNAYESFIRDLEDRRLKGRNRRRASLPGSEVGFDSADIMGVKLEWRSAEASACVVSEIRLVKDGLTLDTLAVGDAQDADPKHTSAVLLGPSSWSPPKRVGSTLCRALEGAAADGTALFRLPGVIEPGDYAVVVHYRAQGQGRLTLSVTHNELTVSPPVDVPTETPEWNEWTCRLGRLPHALGSKERAPPTTYRWPGESSVTLLDIALTDATGHAAAVFAPGSLLRLSFGVRAHRTGSFCLVAGASLYRSDGLFVSNLVGPETPLTMEAGDTRALALEMSPLNLGDGDYVFSLSIFEKEITEAARYDLLNRCIEFKVLGNAPVVAGAVFQHQAQWSTGRPSEHGGR